MGPVPCLLVLISVGGGCCEQSVGPSHATWGAVWPILGPNLVPHICRITKVSHPKTIEKDLCHISLVPVVSKVLEDLVYPWVIEVVKSKLFILE